MGGLSLLLFCLCLWVQADRCEEEIPVPKSLPIDPSRPEYHLHGHFRADLNTSRVITFSLAVPSYLRVYLGEHAVIDMDVYLRNGSGYYLDYSIEQNDEEMMADYLPAGDYTIELVPFTVDANSGSDRVTYECQFIEIEIVVSSVETTHSRLSAYGSPTVRLPGPFDFASLAQGLTLNYSTSYGNPSEYGAAYVERVPTQVTRVIQRIPFELKPKAGTNPIFHFSATLGYNFLTGGVFRLLLDPSNATVFSPDCLENSDKCLAGRNQEANLNVISSTLNGGSYTLWIIELSQRRLPLQPGHVNTPDPISFSLYINQLHSDETFVSCDVLPLPTSFNQPGLIDDTGYLYFREAVLLDLTKTEESVTFRVPTAFLFRAWSEAHRIDIDFQITNSHGDILARTYRPVGQEESVLLELDAQVEYTLTIKYFSNFQSTFCENILMEIMIQPLSPGYSYDYCTGHSDLVPTFPDLSHVGATVRMPGQNYYHTWAQNHTEIISRVEITPTIDMRLYSTLDSHFLDGLTLNLKAVNTTARQPTPYNYQGGRRLSVILAAGKTFVLWIQGGPHQYLANASAFSPCTFFDFRLSLTPVSGVGSTLEQLVPSCNVWHPDFPTSLAGPSYFGTSNRVHFQEQFRFPTASGFGASSEVTFTVRTRSLFRAYTEPRKGNDVDIDFSLTENGIQVPHVIKEFDEEKISHILQPGKTYVFKLSFYTDFSRLGACAYYNLEFEVAPIQSVTPSACVPVLPPPNSPIRVAWLMSERFESHVYAWEQSNNSLKIKIPLIIETTSPVFVRLSVAYDFVWSDISIRLINTDDGSTTALGENAFNKNQILGLQLFTGNYSIEIFEPEALEEVEFHHCTDFVFSYGIAPSPQDMFPDNSVQTEDDDDPDCKRLYLPNTLNDVSHLSVLSGESFHTSSMVRIHNTYTSELVRFDLTKTSVVRVYVPPFSVFDVDVLLYSFAAGGVRTTISKSIKYHDEESIFETLTAGSYGFEFKFYFKPRDVACLSFPIEFGIAPVDYITEFIHLNPSSCASPTTALQPFVADVDKKQSMSRTTSTREFSLKTTFSLTEASLFQAKLDYSFFVGHMSFTLEGTNIQSPFLSAPSERSISSYIAQDAGFFDHVLYPGNYSLVIEDSTNYSTPECTLFSLQYQLTTGLVPATYCDDADRLPSDTFSYRGRSRYYGGPQKTDGTVHISGKHFILPDIRSHSDIEFYVHQPSFVRAWAKFSEPTRNDVDFLLWKNASKMTLISASAGMEAIESHSIFLQPQSEPYVFDVFVFNRAVLECNFLHFEFVVEPNSSVLADMVCPVPLPSPLLPPSEISIRSPEFSYYGEMFVFTNQYLAANKVSHYFYDEVTYEMNITIEDAHTYELDAGVGYNFLWSDFSLELWQNGVKKATSTADVFGTDNSWNDFRSVVDASVTGPGTYLLKIREKIYSQEQKQNLVGTCEKFSFALMAYVSDGGHSDFRITSVSPPTGRELSTDVYLKIDIAFSQPVTETHRHDLVRWLAQGPVVYLRSFYTKYYPIYASWNPQSTVLTVNFLNLVIGRTYSLHIDAAAFKNSAGTSALNYTQTHTYSTMSCDCGGHGVCASTNQSRAGCICDFPFAGLECRSCVLGWHRVGTVCYANTPCTASSCNGHGTCTADQGYPVCLCNPGYESTGVEGGECGKCHTGYSGYPNCKKDPDSRDLHCEAPLLPTSLGTVAYLKVDGTMHLQGDYYIDVNHNGHDMAFTIAEESYFRVYTEPHEVDIDLWLFKTVGETEVVVAFSISYNGEETFFLKLTPGDYRLSFQFLLFREGYSSCPTFNLALAFARSPDFQRAVARYSSVCGSSNVLPDIQLPFGTVPLESWSWAPNTTFSVVNQAVETVARDFMELRFKVPKVPHKVAVLQMEVGYRYLSGDIASRLARHGGKNDKAQVIGYGYNGYNQHYIRQKLEEGEYSLYLYLPAPANKSISPCSLFTFQISTYFELQDEDVFNCPFSELPESFDSPTIRGENGHVVISDKFLVEEWNDEVEFSVVAPSVIRSYASSTVPVSYILEKKTTAGDWVLVKAADNGDLFFDQLVTSDHYRLSFKFIFIDSFHFCPTLNLVVTIMDLASSIPVVECSEGHAATLPSIPNGHITLPYLYDGLVEDKEIEFVSYPSFGSVVGSWTLSWTDNIVLEVRVGADFLSSNMHLELTPPDRGAIRSTSNLHEESLVAELNPGSYTLRLLQANRSSVSSQCNKFSFWLRATTLNDWKSDSCNALNLEEIPTSLSTLRFTGERNEIKVFSDKWKIPTMGTSMIQTKRIYFNVTQESMIRVYIGPHVIDIDVALYRTLDPLNSLARGADLLGEESFVTVVPQGEYFIRLLFWGTDAEKPACMSFNMQIAVAPTATLHFRKEICETGGGAPASWPSVPDRIAEVQLPFQHTYTGFYQQTDHNEFTHSLKEYTISILTTVDLHVDLDYNFLLGDMAISLTDAMGTTVFGQNTPSRHILNAKALPAGTYKLQIYEAAQNWETEIACSDFTISFLIDKAKTTDARSISRGPGFPTTLDSIEYLKYSDEIHIQEPHYVMRLPPLSRIAPSLSFTLRVKSVFRVSTGLVDPIKMSLDTSIEQSKEIWVVLDAGEHHLHFHLTDFRFAVFVAFNLQLAIQPVSDFKAFATVLCQTQLPNWVPPAIAIRPSDGLYQYSNAAARYTASSLANGISLPFQIEKESIISVQIYYQYILSHLDLGLNDAFSTRHGLDDWNMNDLNTLVLPGKFNLTINPSTLALPAAAETDFCGEFALRISISPVGSGADRIDCSSAALFPWDLNSPLGGSADFGGPMLAGSLTMWGQKFLSNSASGELTAKFTISTESLVSLFIHQHSWSSLRVDLIDATNQAPVRTSSKHQNYFQSSSLFYATAPGGTPRDFIIKISSLSGDWVGCSTFTFGVAIQPVPEIYDFLESQCTALGEQKVIPHKITTSPVEVHSYFTSSDIASYTVGTIPVFTYDVEFSITHDSALDVTLQYNPLVSSFLLQLYSRENATAPYTRVIAGIWEPVDGARAGLTQIIDYNLQTARAKDYKLTIGQPNLTHFNPTQQFCFPFTFVFQLEKIGDSNSFVRYVEPGGGDHFDPKREIWVELRFSGALFDSANKAITRSIASQTYLMESVQLIQTQTGGTIFPHKATQPDDNPTPDDMTRWLLQFPRDKFEYGTGYRLALVPRHLFSAEKSEMQLRTNHTYIMSPFNEACSGNGHWNGKKCICEEGTHHTGSDCSECEEGFNLDTSTGACVRPAGCAADTCGCTIASTEKHCISLGKCSSLDGNVVCSCPINYGGDRCEKCAPGYADLKRGCVKDCNPSCGDHGVCDQSTNTCTCAGNFDPATNCKECKTGWIGANCNMEASTSLLKTIGIIVSAVIGVLIIGLAAWYWRMKQGSKYVHLANDFGDDDLGNVKDSQELGQLGSSSESDSVSIPEFGAEDIKEVDLSDSN